MQFIITPMTDGHARQIVEWKYDGPYALYDYDKEAGHILDSAKWGRSLFAVENEAGQLCGELTIWFQNAADERVPQDEVDASRLDASRVDADRLAGCHLWIGFGMRPDLTGQGLGLGFVTACAKFAMAFARDHYGYSGNEIHLGVYQFNQRAIKAYERAGFVKYYEGSRVKNGVEYKTLRMRKRVG